MGYNTKSAALRLAAKGFPVFRLMPGSKLPLSPKLGQTTETWPNEATTDPDKIERIWGNTDYNIGIATGSIFVIDIDTKNGKLGLENARALELDFDTYTVETPSGGLHLYYADEGLATSAGKLAPGIDTRGAGGFVVAPGSFINGTPYRVVKNTELRLADTWVKSAVGEGSRASREKAGEALGPDDETSAHTASLWLQNAAPPAIEGENGDLTTYQVCARVREYGLSEETALYIINEYWNDRCEPPWDYEDLAKKVHNAYKYGQADAAVRDLSSAYEGLDISAPVYKESLTPPIAEGRIQALRDGKHKRNPDWLIKKLLPRVGIASIYGPSGSGKSLLMQDLVWAVGEGRDFAANKCKTSGGTLILAPEAAGLIGARMDHGKISPDVPIVWADVPNFMAGNQKWDNLTALLNEGRKRLYEDFSSQMRVVVIDTYSASGIVEDENDNALAQHALTTLSEYAKKAEVLFIIVHHTDKAGRDMRGAGAMRGALDAAISVENDSGGMKKVSLSKSKMAPEREIGYFKVKSSQFKDSEGELDSVPVLEWLSAMDVPDIRPLQANKLLEALETLYGQASIFQLRKAFGDYVGIKDDNKLSRTFDPILEWLLKSGEIFEEDNMYKLKGN